MPGIEVQHRGGEHVRGVVADQLERLGIAVGDDRDLRAVGQRRGEVAQLAVDLDRERGARQPGADRGGEVGAGGAVGELLPEPSGSARASRRDASSLSSPAVDAAALRSQFPVFERVAYLNAGTTGRCPPPPSGPRAPSSRRELAEGRAARRTSSAASRCRPSCAPATRGCSARRRRRGAHDLDERGARDGARRARTRARRRDRHVRPGAPRADRAAAAARERGVAIRPCPLADLAARSGRRRRWWRCSHVGWV